MQKKKDSEGTEGGQQLKISKELFESEEHQLHILQNKDLQSQDYVKKIVRYLQNDIQSFQIYWRKYKQKIKKGIISLRTLSDYDRKKNTLDLLLIQSQYLQRYENHDKFFPGLISFTDQIKKEIGFELSLSQDRIKSKLGTFSKNQNNKGQNCVIDLVQKFQKIEKNKKQYTQIYEINDHLRLQFQEQTKICKQIFEKDQEKQAMAFTRYPCCMKFLYQGHSIYAQYVSILVPRIIKSCQNLEMNGLMLVIRELRGKGGVIFSDCQEKGGQIKAKGCELTESSRKNIQFAIQKEIKKNFKVDNANEIVKIRFVPLKHNPLTTYGKLITKNGQMLIQRQFIKNYFCLRIKVEPLKVNSELMSFEELLKDSRQNKSSVFDHDNCEEPQILKKEGQIGQNYFVKYKIKPPKNRFSQETKIDCVSMLVEDKN